MNNKKIVLSAIIGLLIAVFIKQNILSLQVVRSNAMSPNIVNGNWLILNKIKNVSRGTIIIYKMPSYNGKDYLIGRVIGVSGDMVKYQNGYLTVNNKKVSDWYLNYQENIATSLNDSDWSIQSLSRNLSWPIKFQNTSKVKKNSFFVLNDNRSITLDSRTYGFVEQKNVLGIVQALPFDKNAENINGNKKEFFKK